MSGCRCHVEGSQGNLDMPPDRSLWADQFSAALRKIKYFSRLVLLILVGKPPDSWISTVSPCRGITFFKGLKIKMLPRPHDSLRVLGVWR